MTFTLDTSSEVRTRWDMALQWHQLDPFTQGFVEAAFASLEGGVHVDRDTGTEHRRFSDLAPETLARFMEDCERFRGRTSANCRKIGALFWKNRSAGYLSGDGWMPLALYLNDEGRVCVRGEAKAA